MQNIKENTANKKIDLRVIKTKNAIKEVFMALCKEKHLDKITVTEIAKLAIINKGTFYLHYRDTYALFDETLIEYIQAQYQGIDFFEDFFSAPKEFTKKFLETMQHNFEQMKEDFPYFNPKQSRVPVPAIISDTIKNQIYTTEKVKQSLENDILLEYMFAGLLHTLRHTEMNMSVVVEILSDEVSKISLKLQ